MSNYLPVIGITMGDAAGVGPEIVVKSLTHESVYRQCRPLVIGDAARLEQANRIVGGNKCAASRSRRMRNMNAAPSTASTSR
jgi:4-hydroxy-L-threonine phosphate dehydrogenase PdxA